MNILSIDLGSHCGWCIVTGDSAYRSYDSGVWHLKGSRFDGAGMRYVRFRERLAEVLPRIERVAFEEVRRLMGVDAGHVYGGLLAVLQEECERRSIPYEGIPVGTIKKTATGKGNADKAKMLAAAHARWPHAAVEDDNQADALWIAECVVLSLPAARQPAEPLAGGMK